jgi:hypothetical protein
MNMRPETRWLRSVSIAAIAAELERRQQAEAAAVAKMPTAEIAEKLRRRQRLDAARDGRADADLARRYLAGETLNHLAVAEGLQAGAVRRRLIAQLGAQRYRRQAILHEARARTQRRADYAPWTPADVEVLRRDYGRVPAPIIAAAMGRNVWQVRAAAKRYGLASTYAWFTKRREDIETCLRSRNAEGWPDAEVAQELGLDRHAVSGLRRRLGLPSQQYSERVRRKTAAAAAEQCRRMGVPNMGKLRVQVYRARARASGWPEDLRWRAVQILNALWDHGPMTRRQLAEAIGMPWKEGVHCNNLTGNGPGGTYTAELMRRGLVVCMGRIVPARSFRGHPTTVAVYSLPLTIQRAQPTLLCEAATQGAARAEQAPQQGTVSRSA